MKPARSATTTALLSSDSAKATTSSTTSGAETTVRTTSTKPRIGAGLKKCIPTTRSGRPVATESVVTDRLEVLVARMVSGSTIRSSSARTRDLRSASSGTASMISWQPFRSARSVVTVIAASVAARSSSVSLPRSTARAVDRSSRALAAAAASADTSAPTTWTPWRATTSAIPAPMVPRPTMPTLLIRPILFLHERCRAAAGVRASADAWRDPAIRPVLQSGPGTDHAPPPGRARTSRRIPPQLARSDRTVAGSCKWFRSTPGSLRACDWWWRTARWTTWAGSRRTCRWPPG